MRHLGRKKSVFGLLILSLTATLLFFQNCGQSFQSKSQDGSGVLSASSTFDKTGQQKDLTTSGWDATTDSLFDPVIFQWKFYLDTNPDLRKAGIVDENGARRHWQTYGVHEGRSASPSFYSRDYLYLNPDLTKAFSNSKDPYWDVIRHYMTYGRKENRPKRSPTLYGFDRGYGDTIAGNEQIYLRTESRYAGTITDFVFRGVNFENSHDTGRLFQTALFFADSPNQITDCENPNEAGTGADFAGPISHSNLQYTKAENGSLDAVVAPAYWFTPGTRQSICNGDLARGKGTVSDSLITKNVKFGFEGDPQIVVWRTTTHIPAVRRDVFRLEAQTGYLNLGSNQKANFSDVFGFNPWTSQLEESSAAEIGVDSYDVSTHAYPTVYSTPDGAYAIGVLGLDQEGQTPDNMTRLPTNHRAKHSLNISAADPTDATAKWSLFYDYRNAPGGDYQSDAYLVVGTKEEVRQRMAYLIKRFPHQTLALLSGNNGARVFDPDFYAQKNPDVVNVYGRSKDRLLFHFLKYGIFEGRQASAEFNARNYLNRYSDLKGVFGSSNYISALKHYLEHGILEGRNGG